jgi:hypothetical protein
VDRLNHVKIATPDPEAVDRFLREVVDIPESHPLGSLQHVKVNSDVVSPARDSNGEFTRQGVYSFRGNSEVGGFIVGNGQSRGFQILHADTPKLWAVAIGTRDLEGAHERCVDRGIPCTEPDVTAWLNGESVRFFFAEVGGIVFEVLRME